MEYHVFAVWDFMSLLKSLQKTLTTVTLPWFPSSALRRLNRLINEIVLSEESDHDHRGQYNSHFNLYLEAMDEIGADKSQILNYLSALSQMITSTSSNANYTPFEYQQLYKLKELTNLPASIQEFIGFTLKMSLKGQVEEVASCFFFGREKLIFDMFQVILEQLKSNHENYPALIYYLERHIEVDQGEHGSSIWECLLNLCENDTDKWERVMIAAAKSLRKRNELWNATLLKIKNKLII